MSASGQGSMHRSLDNDPTYLSMQKWADLTIICNGRQWAVHKNIVCPPVKFFDRACSSGFQESHNGQIELHDDDPQLVDKFLLFLYNKNYFLVGPGPFESGSVEDFTGDHILFDCKMIIIADKYDAKWVADAAIASLKGTLGRYNVEKTVTSPGFTQALELAYEHGCPYGLGWVMTEALAGTRVNLQEGLIGEVLRHNPQIIFDIASQRPVHKKHLFVCWKCRAFTTTFTTNRCTTCDSVIRTVYEKQGS